MSQEEYRKEHRADRPDSGRGGRRAAPSRPEGEHRAAPRRRRRKGLGAWGVLLYVIFVLGISALLAGVGWLWANDVLALNKASLSAAVEIVEGDTVNDVADKLKEAGLIEYKPVFKLFCALTHVSGRAGEEGAKITPGTYHLDTDMDYRALISSMGSSSASRMVTKVTIPEGLTQDQIFALLEEEGVSTVEQLTDTAASYDFNFSFLKGVLPLGDAKRLEGYLFPDTYEFYMGEDPVSVLNKMILRFDEIFTDEMRADIQASGHTIHQAVIIASMIEKETDGQDQTQIASVIYNRLDNPTSETAGYLNIDATILYATGGTEVDVNADTPYNTRTHTGLPPTAIASPGAEALRAAVYPEDTGYYFYALGDDGLHHFFSNYQGQQNFIATQERYQNG